ncbi:MAG: PAS domain S-box protein [Planctomycetaceae bacterium]
MNGPQTPDEASHEQRDWLRVTLSSIGDAVITTDSDGRVTFLNPVAESLTGWTQGDAYGQPLDAVFQIINQDTRKTVESPTVRALRDGVIVGLANHTLLISRDGTERPIDDSAAPIRNDQGEVAGVVLVFRNISERHRQERTIQDTLNYAHNIIATLREPFLVINGDLKVHTANRSFYENFRVTPAETEGRFIYDLGNGQWDIPGLRAVLSEVLEDHHAVLDYEVEHDFPAIGRRFMLLNAVRIRKPGNHSHLILLAIEDVTERRRAQLESSRAAHEIQRHAEQFQTLLYEAPLGVYLVDGDFRIAHVNPTTFKVFGDLEVIGRDFDEVIHILWPKAYADEIVQRFRHTLETGEPYRTPERSETRLDRGVTESYEWQINRIPLPDGGFGVVCYFRDISERVFARQALLVSEIRYRRLFEAAKDGILILDAADGKVSDANPFMSDLLGHTHDHFLGKELWEIGMFSDKSANEAAVRELQQNGYIRYEHFPLESKTGTRVEVEIVANVYQEDHAPVIQCNIRDITERSRLEQELREQAEALADLHRRKDEFLAMLSHELRNPLAPILNAVQLLGLQKDEGRLQRQARTIIERQVGQLSRLVDDLLEVSRITTGRIHLHQERVAFNGIVEHAVETVRPLIEQRRHALEVTLPPQPIWLHADASRLEQVVVNLLTNAAKYTNDAGQIALSVQQEGAEAVLRVRDSGVGIAPELLPRVFDLFTQAERSLDRAQGGLGIGLCLVQRLVELHQGRVEAHSSLGRGSEFVVRLPVAQPESGIRNLESGDSPADSSPRTPDSGLRVLVVDDNVDAAQMLGMLLQTSGHDVRTAHDGPAALEATLDYRPHVVLLDIGLPGMNGLEVARRLRLHPELGNMVLVAMTGYGQAADRQRSREAGFDHHLVKPADFEQVRELLASVQDQASGVRGKESGGTGKESGASGKGE